MTDNEIIKALENEIHLVNYVNGFSADNVSLDLLQNILDLINRQQAKIERLEMTIEINANMVEEINNLNENIRAKAIKDFAEKLKQEDFDHCIDVIYDGSGELNRVAIRRVLFNKQIDNLVKEMTESEVKINDK